MILSLYVFFLFIGCLLLCSKNDILLVGELAEGNALVR